MLALLVGAMVTYAVIDHVVRGTLGAEGGITWREHLLDGTTGRRWRTVEDDEGELEMTLWMRREGAGLFAFERWAPTQARVVSTGRTVSHSELTVNHAVPGT